MPFFKLIEWCWIIVIVFWVITASSTKRTLKEQSAGSRLRYSIFFGLALWLLWGSHFHGPHDLYDRVLIPRSTISSFIGLVITALGLLLAIWARVTLGGNWSGTVTFKEDHELITRGPYSFVRHPIYTALLLMYMGTAIAIGTTGGLVGLPIFFLSFWIKYKQEEALMIEHFGDQYQTYRKRVKALIPFVF